MNSSLYKNECEIKVKIKNDTMYKYYKDLIKKIGYEFKNNTIETDFVPDVNDFWLRKSKVVFRIRFFLADNRIENYLVTLKIKNDTNVFQDNFEIEFDKNNINEQKLFEINRVLYDIAKVKISKSLFETENIEEFIWRFFNNGFTKCRMFSQKSREEYFNKKNNTSVCFDCFPKHIGTYMEIEAFKPELLKQITKQFDIKSEDVEKLNYGKLIQTELDKQGIPKEKRRICAFDENLEQIIYNIYN